MPGMTDRLRAQAKVLTNLINNQPDALFSNEIINFTDALGALNHQTLTADDLTLLSNANDAIARYKKLELECMDTTQDTKIRVLLIDNENDKALIFKLLVDQNKIPQLLLKKESNNRPTAHFDCFIGILKELPQEKAIELLNIPNIKEQLESKFFQTRPNNQIVVTEKLGTFFQAFKYPNDKNAAITGAVLTHFREKMAFTNIHPNSKMTMQRIIESNTVAFREFKKQNPQSPDGGHSRKNDERFKP